MAITLLKNTKPQLFAGTIMVALSGYVPPAHFTGRAFAASASISMTGSFITGFKLAPGTTVKLGAIAATDINGSVVISPAGVVSPGKGVTAGGGQQAGSFIFTAITAGVPIDVTVKGLGTVALGPNISGLGPVGTVKMNKIIIDGIGAAPLTIADSGAGTGKAANYAITTANGPIDIGIGLSWGLIKPLGAFSEQIVMTVSF